MWCELSIPNDVNCELESDGCQGSEMVAVYYNAWVLSGIICGSVINGDNYGDKGACVR